jgi:hypothetical protein
MLNQSCRLIGLARLKERLRLTVHGGELLYCLAVPRLLGCVALRWLAPGCATNEKRGGKNN